MDVGLLNILGFHIYWMLLFWRMVVFVICIAPGLLPPLWQLLWSRDVSRNVRYGPSPRNHLDIYFPAREPRKTKPVVVFLCGGGWIIGYKLWSLLQGLRAMQNDMIFVSLDYRNFPQGEINAMLEDLDNAMNYVFNNISEFGGDIHRVYLVGQSAGAHLASLATLRQIKRESQGEGTLWRASWLRGLVGVSGPYNLIAASERFHERGLRKYVQAAIFGGLDQLAAYSPTILASQFTDAPWKPTAFPGSRLSLPSFPVGPSTTPTPLPLVFSNSPQAPNAGCQACQKAMSFHILTCRTHSRFPPITLFHGTQDRSVSPDSSLEFANVLHQAGFHVTIKLYPGKTHTDLILEDPLVGQDDLFNDLCLIVNGVPVLPSKSHFRLPLSLMNFARQVNPF
jgi:prenylcysteine alpha-carboxyl methylesterase